MPISQETMTVDELKKYVFKYIFLAQILRGTFLPTAVFYQMSNLFSRDNSLTDTSKL